MRLVLGPMNHAPPRERSSMELSGPLIDRIPTGPAPEGGGVTTVAVIVLVLFIVVKKRNESNGRHCLFPVSCPLDQEWLSGNKSRVLTRLS